ncbi:MAG: hypothetical protein ACOC7U_02260 [Spirochaetota bacterium]
MKYTNGITQGPAGRGLLAVVSGAVLLLILFPAVSASASGLSVHGSYKSYALGIYNPAFQKHLYGLNTSTMRVQFSLYPDSWIGFDAAYLLYIQNEPQSLPRQWASFATGSTDYRAVDISRLIYPSREQDLLNLGLYHDLDRWFASIYLPHADVYLGRQAVSWGSAKVVNPTDIFAPYSFSELDTEQKKGVDALRVRIPVGAMNEIDAGYVAGEDFSFKNSALFARTRLYVLQTDLSLLAVDFRESLLLGFDMARALGSAGSWAEGAYVLPDAFDSDPAEAYFAFSAGLDYSFSGNLYGYAEYHFNSAGRHDPEGYVDIMQNPEDYPAYSEGNVYLLGRHYLTAGGSYNLMPIFPVHALAIVNLNDWSTIVSFSGEYNIAPDIYVVGGCYTGWGKKPELTTVSGETAPAVSRYRSEFGAYPDMFYTAFKVYF